MNTNRKPPLIPLILCSLILLAVPGCAFWNSVKSSVLPTQHVLAKEATVTTNAVPVSTNVTTQISFLTNVQTGAITQNQIQTTNVITALIVTTNPPVYVDLADTSRIEAGEKLAGTAASAIGIPFASAGAGLLMLITHMTGSFLNARKLKKIQEGHVTALETLQLATKTLVENIQHIRDGLATAIPGYTVKGADGRSMDDKIVAGLNFAQHKAGPEVKLIIENILGDHKDAIAKVEGYIDALIPPVPAPVATAAA